MRLSTLLTQQKQQQQPPSQEAQLRSALAAIRAAESELERQDKMRIGAEKRAQKSSPPPPANNGEITLTENDARDGYEIRFPGPIDRELSSMLSVNGWRFNPGKWKDPRWYCKRTDATRRFAVELVQALGGHVRLTPKVEIEQEVISV